MIFYRAMPIEADGIRTGDYLTPTLRFAREHALTTSVYHGEDYGVFVVLMGKDEYREASNPGEYIYTGEGKPARLVGIAKYNDEYADSEYQRVKLGSKETLSPNQSRLALLVKYANLSKNFALKQTKLNEEQRRRPLKQRPYESNVKLKRKVKLALALKAASETSLDFQDKAEQKAAKSVGQALVDKLLITPASNVYSHLVDIGNYPSFEAWANDIPKTLAEGGILSRVVALTKPLRGSFAMAFGIPALAAWNFNRIGKPATKLRYRSNRLGRPLNIDDFAYKTKRMAETLGSEDLKVDRLTGTPPALVAYVLMRGQANIKEIRELRDEGVVTDDVVDFVNEHGGRLSDIRIALNRDTKNLLMAIRDLNIFEDVPEYHDYFSVPLT